MFSLFLFHDSYPLLRVPLDLAAGCLIVLLVRTVYYHLRTTYHLRHVPGPKPPSLVWGSDLDVHNAVPGQRYREWLAQYGHVVKIKGALRRTHLAISDPRAVKYMLEEHVFDFPKPQGVRAWFRHLVGDGLLSVEGRNAHAHQRRILVPALKPDAMRPLMSTFYDTATQIADTFAARIDSSPDGVIEEDIQWWTNRWSLDNIGLAGFSYRFNSLSGDDNPLAIALEALTNSADNFSSFVMKALFHMFPSILKIPSEKGRRIRQTRETLGQVATSMWMAAKAGGKVEDKSLMAAMMKAEGAEHLSEEEIAAHLRTLVQAGYETTGCQMAWILHDLAQHPHVQTRLREELALLSQEPSFDDFAVSNDQQQQQPSSRSGHSHGSAPYLDAVIRESLRLHPPIIELTHITSKDTVIPLSQPLPNNANGGAKEIFVPAGTVIDVPVISVQTDPSVWGADATEFRPERWLEQQQGAKKRVDSQLLAFSTGPRVCPGRHFAMIEMKALTTLLVSNFVFRPVPSKPIEAFWSFVVRPRVHGETRASLPILVSRVQY